MRFNDGEQVTILPPYTADPVIIEHQHFGKIAGRSDDGFYVALPDAWPPNERFGPFPESRLVKGWTDQDGRCRP